MADISINSYTDGDQFTRNTTTPAGMPQNVAIDADGNFVVTWISDFQDGFGHGVYAQRFNALGQPLDAEFQLNTVTTGNQNAPTVAVSRSTGEFIVTWTSFGQDAPFTTGVYARRFNADGSPKGGSTEFRVNTTAAGNQQQSSVAIAANGNFVVTWVANNDIYARVYDATGADIRSDFVVNATISGIQANGVVAMDANGNFVVVWTSSDGVDSGQGIYAQRFNALGQAVGGEILVNTTTENNQTRPSVAMDDLGNFVVTWSSENQDTSDFGIYGQRFNASGGRVGSEFLVNNNVGDRQDYSSVSIAADGDATQTLTGEGGFVVTWASYKQDATNSWGIYGQRFNASGVRQGPEFLVNATTDGDQEFPAVAVDGDGDAVVVWTSNLGQDGSGKGVFGQQFEKFTNTAPVVNAAIEDLSIFEDSLFEFIVPETTFTDANSDPLTYTATLAGGGALPGWISFDAATRTFRFNPGNNDVGAIALQVNADDGNGGIVSEAFTVTVINLNDVPSINTPIGTQTAEENQPFSLVLPANTFIDPDPGDTLSYAAKLESGAALPSWLSFNATTLTFSGNPTTANIGTYSIALTATDTNSASATETFTINVIDVNEAPIVVTPVGDRTILEDELFSYTFPAGTFADPDPGDTLTYTATLDNGDPLPVWLGFDGAIRTFGGTPRNADVGTFTIKLTATDALGLSVSSLFDLTVQNVNDPPIASAIANQSINEDQLFSFQLPVGTFVDPDVGDSLTYTATLTNSSPLPGWLTFDAATQTFSGTPLNDHVGIIDVRVTATDLAGEFASSDFSLSVINVNDTPVLASPILDQGASVDLPFSFLLPSGTFTDPDVGDTLTYTATLANGNPLPGWLSFNATTRTFSGTPTNANLGTVTVRVTATDTSSAASFDDFNLTVSVNSPPNIVTPVGNQTATEDSIFSYTVPAGTFVDPEGNNPITYSATLFSGNALPAWLSFDPLTQTFSGTPENADVGTIAIKLIATDSLNASRETTFNLTVNNVNDVPVLNGAIADQVTSEDIPFSFTLAAGLFTDPDVGDTLTYTATLENGNPLPVWLSFNPTTLTFSGTPDNADVGAIAIKVTATDGSAQSISDTFTLTVNNVNDAPNLLTPIADQTATEDLAYSFTLPANTFQDVDLGDALVYTATLVSGDALPAWLTFNPTTRTFSGTPVNNDVASLEIRVTATDSLGQSASDEFALSVVNVNDPPVVSNAIADRNTLEDLPFTFTIPAGTFTDPDVGDTLTYTATLANGGPLPTWLSFNAATRTFSGTPANGDVGILAVKVTVTDGSGIQATDTFNLEVINVNDPPTLNTPLTDKTATEDLAFSFIVPASTFTEIDAGDALTYTATLENGNPLPTWLSFNAATQTFSGTPLNGDVGAIRVTVTATDTSLTSASSTFSLTVNNVNDAPTVLAAIPNQSATEADPFTYQFPTNTFQDVDAGDVLTYTATLVSGAPLPAWLSFNAATRTFSGTPANSDIGILDIRVTATDLIGESVADTFRLAVVNVNEPPTLATPIGDRTVAEDAPFSLTVAANAFQDADPGDSLTYEATLEDGSPLPPWLSFDAATRTFNGTPTNGDVGAIRVKVTASDQAFASVSDIFTLTVTNVNDAPFLVSPISDQTASEDFPFSLVLPASTFSDLDVGDSLTYTATLENGDPLPTWLSFNAITRTFGGTPTNGDVGSFSVKVTATDTSNISANDVFTVVVNNVNDAPTTGTAIANQTATEDSPFSLTIPASAFNDPDVGDTRTYSATLVNGDPLPAWLTLNATTGVFSGTPTNGDVGAIAIRVTLTDSAGATAQSDFNLTVANVNDAPIVSQALVNQSAQEASPFTFTVPANAFVDVDAGDTLTYSATLENGNPLPTWLSFNAATRTFSGTPENGDVGTINVSVTATDGSGETATDVFAIAVGNINNAPTLGTPINTQSANEDSPFSFVIPPNAFVDVDAGDTLIYSATLENGNPLPTWLSFNAATRTFSGTPTNDDVGAISIRVTATDASSESVDTVFELTVNNVNDPPTVGTTILNQTAIEDEAFSFSFPINTFIDLDVGDTLTYSATLDNGNPLPTWLSFDATTRTFSGTPANGDVGTLNIQVTATDESGVSTNDVFTLTVNNSNDAPTLGTSINTQTANEDSPFSFVIPSTSFVDIDSGDTLTYTATLNNGNPLPTWLSFNATTRTFSGTPTNGDVGTVSIRITATDLGLESISTTFDLVVNNVNDAPTLGIQIPDQFATEDTAFTYSFPLNAFVDIDAGDSLTYAATLENGNPLPAWLTFDANTRTLSGTPGNDDAGVLTLRVTATDSAGEIASNIFTLTVDNSNDAPTLGIPIDDQIVDEDSLFSFVVPTTSFVDVDAGDTLTYTATLDNGNPLPSWLSFNSTTRTFSGTPTNGDVGTVTVRIAATDSALASVDTTFELTVNNVNDAPTVGTAIPNQSATEDAAFSFVVPAASFVDVDAGDTLTYSATLENGNPLPAWLSFNPTTQTFSGTPANSDVGALNIRVTATDGSGASADDVFTLTVGNVNNAPTLGTPINDQTANEDSPFSFVVPVTAFVDVDAGDSLTYTATLDNGDPLPAWLSFNSATRTFSGTPTNGDVGLLTVRVTAADVASASIDTTFDLVVNNVNDAPTLGTAISNQTATEDAAFSFTVPANTFLDVDTGDSLIYSATLENGDPLPTWLSFNATTRTFSGTPLNGDVGAINIQVTAMDGSGEAVNDVFTLTVGNINNSPTLGTPINDQAVNEDSPFTVVVPTTSFVDVDAGDTLTYTATLDNGDPLPAWLSFNPATRTFSGTPANADVGLLTVRVTATDTASASIETTFDLVVNNVNDAPTVGTAILDQFATEDAVFSFTLPANAFVDVDAGDSLTYSATLENGDPLPTWLSFNATTRTFSGTPGNENVGAINVNVIATDGSGATAVDTFTLTVGNINNPPTQGVLIPAQLATEDSLFSLTIPANAFSDPDVGDTRTYSATLANGDPLPTWLTLNATTGVFSGTPTNGDVGAIAIQLTLTDSAGATAQISFDLTVANVNDAPSVGQPLVDQLAEEASPFTFTVPINAFVDVDAGDTLTYSAELENGNPLPIWLSFDAATRTFSGTPGNGDVGAINVKVVATDGLGAIAADVFSLTVTNINNAPTLGTPIGNQTATEDEAFSFTVPTTAFVDVDAGDTFTYSASLSDGSALPAWLSFDSATRTFSGTPTNGDVGTATVRVTATDSGAESVSTTFGLVVNNVNDSPTLGAAILDQFATENVAFTFTLPVTTFVDVDAGDTLTYSATLSNGNPLPTWLSFNAATRTFSGTPTNSNVGTINVQVTATDGAGTSVSDTFALNVANVNVPPTLATPIPNQVATEDASFSFTLPANVFVDEDAGDSVTLSASLAGGAPLPAWLTYNAATRTFSGTPINANVGNLTLEVTATDASFASISTTFTLTVNNTNDAPLLGTPIPDQAIAEASPFSFAIPAGTFVDIDPGDTLTYAVTLENGNPLPTWLSFNGTTRTFSGTPDNGDVGVVAIRVTATDNSGLSISNTFSLTVDNVNNSPVVNAPIPSQTATEDSPFNFVVPIGTFTDPDVGDTLTYSATLASGGALPAWLSFNPSTRTFSGTPANGDVGTLNVRVIAMDASLATTPAIFALTVVNTNDAPVPNGAIANQLATPGDPFSFVLPAGTFTDPDVGDTLTYTAQLASGEALPGWLSFNPTTRTFSGTPANGDSETLSIRVTATDPSSVQVSGTFDLTVLLVNRPPAVGTAIAPQSATEDSAFNFTVPVGAFTDPDGDSLTYSATLANGSALPSWLAFDALTRTFVGTPTNANVGNLNVRVTAFDPYLESISSTFTLTVSNVNDPPLLVGSISDQTTTDGSAFSFTVPAGVFADPDVGDVLTYSASLSNGNALPSWLSFNGATRTFSGTPTQGDVGVLELRVTATDGGGASISDTFALTINDVNQAPILNAPLANQTATEDSAFSFVVPAGGFADPDGDAISYSATLVDGSALPSWLSFNSATRTFSGTPTNGDVGALNLRLTATDPSTASVSGTFTLTVNNANDAPVLNGAIADLSTLSGSPLTLTVPVGLFSDVDAGDTLTYSATLENGNPLPAWLSFNSATRTFSGTPTASDLGTLNLRVTATDTGLASVSETFALTIVRPNLPPTVNAPIGNQTATEDTAYSFTVPVGTLTDPDAGDILIYSAALADESALPAWLSFNANTLTFSGTPTNGDVGSLSIRLAATDTFLASNSTTFALNVVNVNDAPVLVTPLTNQIAVKGTPFTFAVPAGTFSDVDGDPLTYTATLANGNPLPGWLTFNAATRSFTGIPGANDVGTLSVQVRASDPALTSATSTFTLAVSNVAGNVPPTVGSAIAPQTVNEDSPYSFTVPANTFTDADGDSLTYTATLANGNPLPTWLSFNPATRTFSGTPTNGDVGSVTLRVTATDTVNNSVNTTFTLAVNNVNDAPVVNVAIPDQAIVATSALNFTVAANTFADVDAGDTLTYTATLANGSALPAWLTFNASTRTFSGTPVNGDVGVLDIRITATDSAGASVNDTFSLTVSPFNYPPAVANPIPDQVATEDSLFSAVVAANTFADLNPGDTLTYSATLADGNALPTWLTFNPATRTFSGTPTNENVGSLSIIVTARDPNQASISDTFTLVVNGVNDAPVVQTSKTTLQYLSNLGAIALDSALLVSDVDNTALSGATVTVINHQPGSDRLGFVAQNGITGSFDEATGILQLMGTAPLAAYQTALQSITYSNTSATNSAAPRTIRWTVNDGALDSPPADIKITFGNSAPVLDLNGAVTPGSEYSASGDPTTPMGAASSELILADVDNSAIASALVVISNPTDWTQEFLSADTTGTSINAIYRADAGALLLVGSATASDYQRVLRSITYTNRAANRSGSRRLLFLVSDGDRSSTSESVLTLTGGSTSILITSAEQDFLAAAGADDTLTTVLAFLQQNDQIDGGAGLDTFVLSDGTGTAIVSVDATSQIAGIVPSGTQISGFERFDFSGFGGTVTMSGSNSLDDVLVGGSGNDTLSGFAGNDTLIGNAGDDTLDGGIGTDLLTGGTGNDTYRIDNAADGIVETADGGIDTVIAPFDFTLADRLENLTLIDVAKVGRGNSLGNTLTGNGQNNTLVGAGGNDVLLGNTGRDRLNAGRGNDTLEGGAGRDTLKGGGASDTFTLTSKSGRDRDLLLDFDPKTDRIQIVQSAFGGGLKRGKLASGQFVLGSVAVDKGDRFIYNRSAGALFYDADGLGGSAQTQIATLRNKASLTTANIFIV